MIFQVIKYFKMILMRVSTELSCHGVLETVDDLIIVRTPVFVTQIVSSGNVSYDVNLEKIMHKIYSAREIQTTLQSCLYYQSFCDHSRNFAWVISKF